MSIASILSLRNPSGWIHADWVSEAFLVIDIKVRKYVRPA